MNDFNRASGLQIDPQTHDPRYQEAQERQALEDRVAQMRRDHEQAEKDRQEAAFKAQIEAQTELSLKGNEQLQAQRMGIASKVITSQSAGAVPTMAEIAKTPVKVFGGMEVSYQQAKDMAEVGQITKAEFNKAVVDGLAARGYAAPPSFR
ncbi:MAG: hypothetical protein ACTHOP_25240 [Mesorhizobium sp.]